MRLLSYKYKMLVPFGDGEYRTVYELTLLKSYFFGLFTKVKKIEYSISMFQDNKSQTDHWDTLIESKTKFR